MKSWPASGAPSPKAAAGRAAKAPATVVEGIDAVPPGDAAPVSVADAAPEAAEATAAPLAKTEPADALATPEPAPAAASPDPAARPDFTGKLRGEDVTLPGVKTEPLVYTKRAEADLAALRKKFGSSARYEPSTKALNPRPVMENRSNFLKDLANDADKEAALKAAGIDDNGLALMKQGKVPDPDVWQVHHKLPLDDGGTNAPDNLVLIRNEPFHKVITNEQNALTSDLKSGETLRIPNWPVPDGFVYPPTAPPVAPPSAP